MSHEEQAAQTTAQSPLQRKLAAIFSADVEGYSRLMGDDEVATVRTITAYREVLTKVIHEHNGRVVDSPGDNLLAEFASVVDAVQSAVAVQQELAARNAELPDHRRMSFRIGINVGDVLTENGRLYGDGVNIAARLESLAEAGEICISESAYSQVKNKLALSYAYIGERSVKNITEPVKVYKIELEADGILAQPSIESQPFPSLADKPTFRRWSLTAGVIGAVLLLGLGVLLWRLIGGQDPLPPEPPFPDKPSIAVLPFINLSGDPEQEHFSDGMTHTLITDLCKVSGLFVIAPDSVFTYKNQVVDIAEASRKLSVRYVLKSSVQQAGGRLRVNTRLVDATTGENVWAERYDRELADLFALQDELTQQIVTALEVELTAGEQANVYRRTTHNLAAYDYYLRAMTYATRYTPEANAQARQLFERAIELDPSYADAYALLGFTYLHEWTLQWSHDPQTLERVFTQAQQALALDASLAEPHLLLGYVYLYRDRQHEQAIAEAEQAVVLSPNYTWAHANLAEMLLYVGRNEEAIRSIEQAIRLDPRHPALYLVLLGAGYHGIGRVEEAEAAYKKALSVDPDFWSAHLGLAILYSELGRKKDARAEAAEVLRLFPHFSVDMWKQRLPYQDLAVLERRATALRKAGLK